MNNGWNFVIGLFWFYFFLEMYKQISTRIKEKKVKKNIEVYMGLIQLHSKEPIAFKHTFLEMPFNEQQKFLSLLDDEKLMVKLFTEVYEKNIKNGEIKN
jgi:hypothetical protein